MADKFEDLRIYVAIIDSGGVNAAAAALGIAKSAVSRRLGELEQRLGAELIARTSRAFEPTAMGRRYYERARELLDGLAALDADASSGGDAPAGRLTIAAGMSLGPATAAALATLPPSGGTIVEIVDADSIAGAVVADIWLGRAPPEVDAYERRTGPTAGMCIVGSPKWLDEAGRPGSFADLRALPGIAVSTRPDGGWRFGKEGAHSPLIKLVVPDDASAVAAAIAGAGLARVPTHLAAGPIGAGRLEQVLEAREPASARMDIWIRSDAGGPARRIADHLAATLSGWPGEKGEG